MEAEIGSIGSRPSSHQILEGSSPGTFGGSVAPHTPWLWISVFRNARQ
jgi:hypothetical protein